MSKKKNCIRVIFHWRKKNYIYMHLFFSCSTQLRNYSVTNVRVRLKTSTRVHFVHFFRTNAKCFRNGSAHKHSFFRKKLETRSLKRFLLVPNKSTLKKKKIYIYIINARKLKSTFLSSNHSNLSYYRLPTILYLIFYLTTIFRIFPIREDTRIVACSL